MYHARQHQVRTRIGAHIPQQIAVHLDDGVDQSQSNTSVVVGLANVPVECVVAIVAVVVQQPDELTHERETRLDKHR